jgi:hypothetical protein
MNFASHAYKNSSTIRTNGNSNGQLETLSSTLTNTLSMRNSKVFKSFIVRVIVLGISCRTVALQKYMLTDQSATVAGMKNAFIVY